MNDAKTFEIGGNQGRGNPVRVPITLAEDDGLLTQDTSGLFTSRAFWLSGLLLIAFWTAVVLYYR